MSDLNVSHGKISGFVSFPLRDFILVIKLKNFNFESHWNTLMFFDKKIMVSDLKIFHGKISEFISFPLFGFTLFIELRNFDLEGH